MSSVVSGLRFICGLRQERILFLPVHVTRLTSIALIYLSSVVSGLRFICGLCDLRDERVILLLRLQACLC